MRILPLMAAFLIGVVVVIARWQADSWPARVVFQTPDCAMPLAFSPDGQTFLTSGRSVITAWDVATGRKGKTWNLTSNGALGVQAFSPDGKTFAIALASYPGPLSIDLFDTAVGQLKTILHTSRQTMMHVAFDDDGRTIRAILGDSPQMQGCASWNPAYGYVLNEVVTWDVATGRQTSSRPLTAPTQGTITAISADGRLLAIADPKVRTIQLWDLGADRAVANLGNPTVASYVTGAGLAFSSDSRTLAVGRTGGIIDLWDISSRQIQKTLRGHTNDFMFTAIRFSPDDRSLAVAGYRWGPKPLLTRTQNEIRRRAGLNPSLDTEVLVLDIATDQLLAGAPISTNPSFSPDGKTLVTGEPDGSTRLRDIRTP